jgi:hypothetical protein
VLSESIVASRVEIANLQCRWGPLAPSHLPASSTAVLGAQFVVPSMSYSLVSRISRNSKDEKAQSRPEKSRKTGNPTNPDAHI